MITRPGPPDVLQVLDVPRPLPREGEVLVRVHASALNRADLFQRMGRYPAPPGAPSNIPGLEVAGEVFELGDGVTRWKVGDRVFGIVGGGGNAEFAVTREAELAPVPAHMSWEDAAAVPEAFLTAHDALVTLGRLQQGDRVLIHAVGSGVGLAATQLARALGGSAFGTARTADKVERARDFGLDAGAVVANNDPASIVDPVRKWTDGRGIDICVDLVGGAYLPVNVELAAPQGRIILVGLLAGRSATLDLGRILNQRVSIRGTVMRSRPAREKAEATAAFIREVIPLLERREVRPVVDRVFTLHEIQQAHALLETNETFGKIVIRS